MRRDLTVKQERAVASLNRALAVARKANLALCGMDSQLIAYNGNAFDALDDSGDYASSYEIQQELADESVTLADRGVYRESGGW